MIPGVTHETVHVATLTVATAACVGLGALARAKLGTGQEAVIPASRFSVRGLFEIITEFIFKLSNQVIGHDGKYYVPYFTAIFFFILFNNFFGMIPGMTPATENMNTTFAFGVFSFLAYNFVGFKRQGLHYLKHFVGPIWWMFIIMVPIEIISNLIRPLTLGLRLSNVMRGDHTVLSVFLDLVPIGVPIPFYLMGFLVCMIQAFVFTLLSMVYVALAQASDH
jgi:F-type H+-transporting ATPase subunit a